MRKDLIENVFIAVKNNLKDSDGLRMMKPNMSRNYCNFNFYKKSCPGLVATFVKNGIRITLYIKDNQEIYKQLYEKKEIIHMDFGETLSWEKGGSKDWKIYKYIENEGYEYKNPNDLAIKIINELKKQKEIYLKYLP